MPRQHAFVPDLQRFWGVGDPSSALRVTPAAAVSSTVIPITRLIPCLAAAVLATAGPAAAATPAGTSSFTAPLAPMALALAPSSAPANTAAPWISGAVAAGSTLTTSLGTWTQSPTTYTYQWQQDSGSGFADIPGAVSSTYALTAADTGTSLRVVVTATNSIGSTPEPSPAVGPVDAAVPTNGVLPTVAGTPKRGQTLVAARGTWNPAGSTYAYQWQRDSGSGFSDVTGATGSTYVLAAADVGATLRVVVRATNANGNASATSAATTTVQPLLPASTASPTISGTLKRTFTLAATVGGWNPGGTSYAYQWQSDTGSGFTDISGATASSFTLTAGEVGGRMRVAVTATNVDGATTAYSAPSAVVQGLVPVATASPAITGANRVGVTLTTSNGTWSPAATSYAYQWQRDSGSGFLDIAGATASTYVLTAADARARIRVRVTATNAEGSGQATSAITSAVSDPPVFTADPGVPTGTLMDSYVLTAADPGTWTPASATASYQWLRCPEGATVVSASCKPVGANATYRLTALDVGHPMAVRVTASWSGGAASAVSPVTDPVDGQPLTAVTPPVVGGVVQVAGTAVVTPATWSVTTTSVKYQWQRCDADGTGCADIPGATAPRYAIGLADRNHQLAVRASAISPGRTAAATSAPVAVDDQPLPTTTVLPRVNGQTRRTGTLSATTGTWASNPTKMAYQWQRCDADGSNCADITGARNASLLLTAADVGKAITVVVSATNTSGTVTAAAAPTAPISPVLPILRLPPVVKGPLQVPGLVQVTGTVWSTTGDTRYANQWQRCDADGTGCSDIAGAVGQTYKLTPDDAGSALRVTQTATNPDGAVVATSRATGVIKPPLPSVGRYPRLSISGSPVQVGRVLTLTPATWFNADTVDVQFWRCAPRCVLLDTGGAATYTLDDPDAGAIMRASERATGPGGVTTAYSPTYFGPVRATSIATTVVATGMRATLRTSDGVALATASVRVAAAKVAVARAAVSAPSASRRLTVRLRRARGARGALRAWACAVPVRTGGRPCTAARPLARQASLRIAVRGAQRVRVVVKRLRPGR